MQIRKATSKETNQILHLSTEVAEEATMGYINHESRYPIQMITSVLSSGGYYIIAKEADVIKGWVLIGESQNPFENELIGFITELYVNPIHRKQQIGYKLMKKALENFKEKKIHKVQLNVFKGNPAENLYKRLGFHQLSTIMEISI